MKALIVLILTFIVAEVASLPFQWLKLRPFTTSSESPDVGGVITFCNTTLHTLIINNITLFPYPPQSGEDLTIIVKYTLDEVVKGGCVVVKAKLDDIPLYQETFELCDIVEKVGMKCPIDPITSSYKITINIPFIHGDFKANVKIKDQYGNELGCVNAEANLRNISTP